MREYKNITFNEVPGAEVDLLFNDFFDYNSTFYEIVKSGSPVGFYGVKKVSDDKCSISLYLNESGRDKTSKDSAIACLTFPFTLGFTKILISTKLHKMNRFLSKMTKFGVKYLFKSSDFYWFEVNK